MSGMCFVYPEKQNFWPLAQSWVQSNSVLIWCIAAPYYRYMSCDSSDLAGEAKLAVYQVISVLIDQNKDLSLTSKYFRIVFRTRCIQMAAGVSLANKQHATVEIQKEQSPELDAHFALDESVIFKALSLLTDRQRQVSLWILSQPKPVSFATIANHFGIHTQTVRNILSNTIRRLEAYGNHRICEDV
jgi:RNA polymerase sigma factor (sigma-70 family)